MTDKATKLMAELTLRLANYDFMSSQDPKTHKVTVIAICKISKCVSFSFKYDLYERIAYYFNVNTNSYYETLGIVEDLDEVFKILREEL